MESLLTIEAICKYPSQLDWSIHSRVAVISNLASSFVSCGFKFVPRGANVVAHYLTYWAASQIDCEGYPAFF